MSKLYDVSINEILSRERFNEADYREKAEINIATAFNNSTPIFKEKAFSYKKEWRKKHWWELMIAHMCIFAMLMYGLIFAFIFWKSRGACC